MPIAISASDNASSVTRSGISGGAVVITNDAEQQKRTGQTAEQTVASLNRDVSSDRDGSNSLKPIFDEDEIRAGFEIVTAFSNEASTFLANKAREADLKRKQAKALQEEADKTVGLTDTQRMNLQFSARQLSAEANDISENWGAGGTYRQITTALIGAAGGNISAGNAAFVQGLVVNYVQQRGAGYIGDLVAKGELTEGSPLHAALHGIVACAGAAASSQSCGSGAAGAAASSLLTGLFSQSSPDESEEQREAKRNLIVSLVTGLAATSASVDPTAANTAAGAAVDNNWLATQQEAQARKEYEAAEGLIAKAQVAGKWLAISGKQEILTRYGIGKGLAQSGWGDITGLAEFAMHPIDGLNGLSSLISDPEVRAQLGEEVANKFSARIDTIKNALEVGGDQNAVAMGEAMGELAWQIGTAVTGVGTAAKGVVGLAKAGIKVSSAELDRMANLARMEKIAAENAKNRNPSSSMTDHETTILADRNVLEAREQANASPEIPATSANARVGLREELAAQAGIPRSLDQVWGASLDDLAEAYKMDGATVTRKPPRAGSSGNAQIYIVEGHQMIKEIQYSPGGGVHGVGEYYKFTYKDGLEVRIVDPSPEFKPGTITRNQQYYDTKGNRLKYEGGHWLPW